VNSNTVLFVLGNFLLIMAVCLTAPLCLSLAHDWRFPPEAGGHPELIPFLVPILIAFCAGISLRLLFKRKTGDVGRREGFVVVTFSWLTAVILGMIPFLLSGTCDTVSDAFFETMSGFTTTGATIFPAVEVIPYGLQFWRHMTQWLGGMGIVVLSVALMPLLGVGGFRMLKAETPGGVIFERDRARITDSAKDLWKLYLLISGAEVVLLALSGTSIYDAFCHTFTTMSTGGFSPHSESIAFFTSPITQWVIILFMFTAGISFSLHAQVLRGRIRAAFENAEFRFYLAIIAVCAIVGFTIIPGNGAGLEQRIREVTFQVVSIGTTTGYATVDFDAWPQMMRLVMVMLMFIGGCMGSTGGGMKVARVLVYGKAFTRELHKLLYPHAVKKIRIGNRKLDDGIALNILAFGSLFVAAFIVGSLTMAAFGYDLVTSMSASIAALGNIGPGLGAIGPTRNWAHLPDAAKWVMSFLMLIGRLELYSVLILFTPWVWKR